MMAYHGSDVVVKKPDISHSKKKLDFGCGFYVTTVIGQAERWAKRKAMIQGKSYGVVNIYTVNDMQGLEVRDFLAELDSWIDFVCECRNGGIGYKRYDIIKGKVANDKVFRVVDMYKRGIWDKQRAIQEIRAYENYDQIAFISQSAIDSILVFRDSFEVKA